MSDKKDWEVQGIGPVICSQLEQQVCSWTGGQDLLPPMSVLQSHRKGLQAAAAYLA